MSIIVQLFKVFITLFGELTILFLGISFLVDIIQQTTSEEKMKKMLSTKNKFWGYVNALLLGTFTPFCSCSTIPILAGLIKANAPFGPTITFLFTSPFLDPSVIVLMLGLLGVKTTLIYSITVLIIPTVIGISWDILGFQKYVKNINIRVHKKEIEEGINLTLSIKELLKKYLLGAAKDSLELYVSVLPYLVIGVLFGTVMHNVIPQDKVAKYVGDNAIWAVPIAAIIGIPLYINSTTILPIGVALLGAGVGVGPIIALIIGGTGASIPEIILLKKMYKTPLIVGFIIAVFVTAISAGYLVQLLV